MMHRKSKIEMIRSTPTLATREGSLVWLKYLRWPLETSNFYLSITKFTPYLNRIGITRIGKGPLCATPLSSYNGSSSATSAASKFQTKIARAIFISNKASLPRYHGSRRAFTVFQYKIEGLWKMEDKPFCCTFRRCSRGAIVPE